MDFAQRTNSPSPSAAPAPNRVSNSKKSGKKWSAIMRWSSVVLLFSVAILLLAVAASIGLTRIHQESKYVDSKHYQAVFLTGGQVYFGKIGSLNDKYLSMSNVYYLRVNQAVQPNTTASTSNDVALVKLGCELHGPQDQMVINSSQVTFWENLKADGQVAKAIAEFQKANPNGQDCTAAAATTPAATTKK